ncbi:MAG: hypothetical protein Alis3KO_18490 [Aliiglaciecola sp.]
MQAADRPAGPAPTITTSNSIDSRSTANSPYRYILIKEINDLSTITESYKTWLTIFTINIDDNANFYYA